MTSLDRDASGAVVGPLPRPAGAGRGDGRAGERVLGVGSRAVARCSLETDPQVRQLVLAVAYLVCEQRDLHLELRGFKARKFAGRVFDQALVDAAVGRVQAHMDGLGHPTVLGRPMLTHALTDVMLLAGSPLLGDLGARADLFVTLRSRELNGARRHGVEQLARTLVEMRVLGELPCATQPSREEWLARSQAGEINVPAVWLEWTRRWFETSTLGRSSRTHTYYALIKAGRWLHREHPDRLTRVRGTDGWSPRGSGGRPAARGRPVEGAELELHARPAWRPAVPAL